MAISKGTLLVKGKEWKKYELKELESQSNNKSMFYFINYNNMDYIISYYLFSASCEKDMTTIMNSVKIK